MLNRKETQRSPQLLPPRDAPKRRREQPWDTLGAAGASRGVLREGAHGQSRGLVSRDQGWAESAFSLGGGWGCILTAEAPSS